jgi:hypothetical protein
MLILLTLAAVLTPVFAPAADDIIIPKITYTVTLSSAAQTKIAEGNRKTVAAIYYDGDFGKGDPQTVVCLYETKVPASGGEVTAPPVNLSKMLRDLKTEKGISAKFSALEFSNIYNPPNGNKFNLITCNVCPDGLFNLRQIRALQEIKVHADCKLIGETQRLNCR